MAEVANLIGQEIPEGRHHLQESYTNLDKVAQYCRENYLKSEDKKAALEETKNYTTHSLASVAYQINSLATNFLKLLDLQQNVVAEMESSVNYLSQTVNIHKEKVARREIGVLTTNKCSSRPLGVKNGIIFPEQAERPTKYQRKPVDFSLLDDIGHGVKVHDQGLMKTGGGVQRQQPNHSQSNSSQQSSTSQAPTARPPTPPQTSTPPNQKGHYRTPAPPVAPPSIPMTGGPGPFNSSVPSNYSMGQITALPGQHSQVPHGQRRSGYGQGQGPPPPVGTAHPQTRQQIVSQGSVDAFPPPPSPGTEMSGDGRVSQILEASPPLPPPPPTEQKFDYPAAPPPAQFTDVDEEMVHEEDPYAPTGPMNLLTQDWVPNQYLEKVIAIYDYDADKADELSFLENSVIYVLKKNDDGWYEGVCNGVTGLFPGNYVDPCM